VAHDIPSQLVLIDCEMQNWGLVTYREVDLLIDPVTASSSQKQRVATVVTHELAHQWFGNLVTMEWWDDLWLNEGFASWAENWAADKLYPDYAMWSQFTTGHLSAALRLDALKTSHPIQVPIYHAEEVEQVFDAISYCKGGSVVRMIKAVLGMQTFQTGLANYMKQYAYGNTTTVDLWNAWAAVSNGLPVQEMMASWTEQMGFPLVKVINEDWSKDENAVTLQLEQRWFIADGSDLDAEGAAKTWTIPILSCNVDGSTSDMTLMREATASVTIPLGVGSAGGGKDRWVKLNAGQEVPMRVLHSAEMLRRLAFGIQDKSLHAIDRASLLNDAYALVKAGHQSPTVLIRLLGNYANEDDYIVWEGLSEALGGLNTILSDAPDICALFQPFAKKLVLNLMTKIGWDAKSTDGHLTNMLRGIMIGLLSAFAYDDEAVVKEATTRFAAFQADAKDVTSLPSDMRTPVFAIVLKNGRLKEYEAVKSYFNTADNNAERKHVLSSLGSIPDPKLKLAVLEWCTSGEIKLQDFFYAMGSVSRSSTRDSRVGRDIAWQYFQDNLEKIKAMIGMASSSLMDACIINCAGNFCSNEKADEVDAFFTQHPLPSSSRKIAQVTEQMRANAKFLSLLQDSSELADPAFWASL
jgi:puromycin-sensitive aminopeptidase